MDGKQLVQLCRDCPLDKANSHRHLKVWLSRRRNPYISVRVWFKIILSFYSCIRVMPIYCVQGHKQSSTDTRAYHIPIRLGLGHRTISITANVHKKLHDAWRKAGQIIVTYRVYSFVNRRIKSNVEIRECESFIVGISRLVLPYVPRVAVKLNKL